MGESHTLAILELLLDHWIIDIGQDLVPLQLLLHAVHSDLLPVLSSTSRIVQSHDLRDLDPHVLDQFDLFCPIGSKNLSRILEALVW